MEYLHRMPSPLGGILLSSDGEALTGLWFEGQKYFGANLPPEREERPLAVFAQTEAWLAVYFGGTEPDFTPPLSPRGTAFQKEVWDVLRTIPWGRTVSYGEIAAVLAGRRGLPRLSAQAVGGAVGRNPVSVIIPCHRVVGSDGALVGYAGGLDRKESLLRREGVRLLPNGHAERDRFPWGL